MSEEQKAQMKANIGTAVVAMTNPVVIGIAVGVVLFKIIL